MATTMWIGGAPVVEHVGTITIANTWAANDTLTVTINGKIMTLTIGTAAATTDVATALQAAWEGTVLGAGYSVNFTGQECAEFYELISTVNGSVVTLTERAAGNASGFTEGKTFTITAGETTAGTGTATYATTTTPTGPHHIDNNNNWSTGTAVTNNDVAIFSGDYDCKYMLDRSASITNCTLRILGSFTGQLGLPRLRSVVMPDGQTQTYEEYRDQYFKVTTGGLVAAYVGYSDGDGPTLVKIDPNTASMALYCNKTGEPEIDSEPVVFVKNGANTSDFLVEGGSVGIGFYPDETATPAVINVSQSEDGDESLVVIGAGVATSGAGISVNGGTVDCRAESTDIATVRVGTGGVFTANGKSSGTIGSLKLLGGTANLNCAATVTTTIATSGSVINLGDSLESLVFTNFTLYAGAALLQAAMRSVTYTNGIILGAGVLPTDVTLPTQIPLLQTSIKTTVI